MGRSQRHKIEEQGYSSRGEIYEQGAVNDQVLKALGGTLAGMTRPVLSSISPTTAVKGGADLTLTATGTDFDANTKIIFNGGVENTTFVGPTSLTTIVKPSLVSVAGSYPVQVRKGAYLLSAATKMFTFTSTELQEEGEGEESRQGQDERERGPFDLLRIEPDEEGGAWYVFKRTNIREGDTLRAEATGNSATNGDFEVRDVSDDVADETAVYWSAPTITADIVGKGRITIL